MLDPPPRQVFHLSAVPQEYSERSWKAIATPDDIKVGDLLMPDRSLEIRVEVIGTDPPRVRLDNGPPAPPGPFRVIAYDFPFLAAVVEAGSGKGQCFPVDVRMHHFVRIRQGFLTALLTKKPAGDPPNDPPEAVSQPLRTP